MLLLLVDGFTVLFLLVDGLTVLFLLLVDGLTVLLLIVDGLTVLFLQVDGLTTLFSLTKIWQRFEKIIHPTSPNRHLANKQKDPFSEIFSRYWQINMSSIKDVSYQVRHFPMAIIFREKWKKYCRINGPILVPGFLMNPPPQNTLEKVRGGKNISHSFYTHRL